MDKNEIFLLLIIVILAFLVRTPGVFWGYHVFGNENIGFNPDESPVANIADNFLSMIQGNFKKLYYDDYVKGLPFQVSLLAFPLTFFIKMSLPVLAGLARGISLIYGILTMVLVYFISLKIFKSRKTAILSSLFLTISGLHVTYSHIGKPDSGNVFWIYFVFFFSYMYMKDKRVIYIILASIGNGFAAGTKFSVVQVIPLIYILFKSGKKKIMTNILLIIFITAGSFALINGFSYTPSNFLESVNTFSKDLDVRAYNKFLNIPLHIFNLFTGLGMFIFLFSLYGFILILKKKKIEKDFFFIFILPMIVYIIQFCNTTQQAPPRYMLPLIPLLVIIASYGLNDIYLKLNKKTFIIIFLFIIIYQTAYIFSSEINYIHDPRGLMGEWMLKNIDLNSKIYIGDAGNKYLSGESGEYFIITNKSKISNNRAVNRQGIVIPSEFRTVDDFNDADYIVMMNNRKYLRSSLNPLRDPLCCREVFYCHDYNECVFTQSLFRGKLQFKLIKKIESNALMPELWLYKKLLGTTYSDGIEDIFLFKKSNDISQIEK